MMSAREAGSTKSKLPMWAEKLNSAPINLATDEGTTHSASRNWPYPIVFFGKDTTQSTSKYTTGQGSFQTRIIVFFYGFHDGRPNNSCRCFVWVMIMRDISTAMVMTSLPVKMKVLGACSLYHHFATSHITRIIPSSRMVFLSIFIPIASFCLRIRLVSMSWTLQRGKQESPWEKSN